MLSSENELTLMERNLTEGSVFGNIVRFSLPYLLSYFLQTLYGMADLFTDAADGAQVVRLGGQYLRGYIWDCCLAGVQFSFSGYFCAIGRSELSFLHNFLSILLARVPGAYLASRFFPQTLFPMGLASAAGSLVSIVVCVSAYALLRRHERT